MVGIAVHAPPVHFHRHHQKAGSSEQKQHKQSTMQKAVDTFSISYVSCHIVNAILTYIICTSILSFQNSAIHAMAFYGVYHRDPYNQLIHFFGVPGIIYSLLLFQCHLSILPSFKITWLPGIPSHSMNWATIWSIIYAVFYVSIDLWGSICYLPILYVMYGSAVYLIQNDQMKWKEDQMKKHKQDDKFASTACTTGSTNDWMGSKRILYVALFVHVFSWYVQIHLGHYIYEGAQPAVLQSIGGALTTAPLFAFYEFIWYMGLRQQFHRDVLQQVAVYTKQLCEDGIKMRACLSP